MTNKTARPHDTLEQSHEQRIQRCAELGQIVPIDKARVRQHYESMVNQLPQQAPAE